MTKMFAIHDENAIYGIGASELDAVNDAIEGRQLNDESAERCPTSEMTPALAALVADRGGAVAFHKLRDGRLGTWEEFEAA